MANSTIAYRSSINIQNISKSVSSLRKSVSGTQKTAVKMNSVLGVSNRNKRQQISRSAAIFQKRQEATKRREREDIIEASGIGGAAKRSGSIVSSSTKGFLGRLFDFVGTLMVGWVVNNLPTILSLSKVAIKRVQKLTGILSNTISGMGNILVGFGGLLSGIYSNVVSFDFTDSQGKISNSLSKMDDGFDKVRRSIIESINLLSGDINKLFGFDIPEIPVPDTDTDLDTGTRGTPGTGGGLQPIHKQALDIIARPESGAAGYNAMNQGTDKNGNIIGSTVGGKTSKDIIGKNLTDMTIGEVMDRQDESKYPRGARPDRGIHAAGRYQIIGSTMKSAVKLAGLSRSDKFDEANQDLLGIAVLKSQGIGAWTVGGSRYSAKETAIVNQAKNTPLGKPTAPPTPTRSPGTTNIDLSKRYKKGDNIQGVGTVTSLFGPRKDPFTGEKSNHGGLDIGMDSGMYISCTLPCKVVESSSQKGYGKYMDIIIPSLNIRLRFGHLSAQLITSGQVAAGVPFARSGNTGRSTAPHVHLEATKNMGGTAYGGDVSPDPYVSVLMFTKEPPKGFTAPTVTTNKPSPAQINTEDNKRDVAALKKEKSANVITVPLPEQPQVPSSPTTVNGSSSYTSYVNYTSNFIIQKLLLDLAYT